jgi:excisionase family DNA binding protein
MSIREVPQREAFSIHETSIITGIGTTKLYEAIGNKTLKSRKLGKKRLILRSDLEKFLQALPAAEPDNKAYKYLHRARWPAASKPGRTK